MDVSTLTKRDRQLAEAGYPPLDVTPARRLSRREINEMSFDQKQMFASLWRTHGRVPCIERGYLCYKTEEELCSAELQHS